MAAEACKQKFVLQTAALTLLLLLSLVIYCTVTDTFVADELESDPAFDVVYDTSLESDYYHSKQSSAIGSEQTTNVVIKVSSGDFCEVMRNNKHLLREVSARRAIKTLCGLIPHSASGSETETVADGESAEANWMQQQGSSEQTSNVNKLSEWCKHRDQIDNGDVRKILPGVCREINKQGTTTPEESSRAVTTEYVTPESNATTEAAVAAVTDMEHSLSNWELREVLCQHLHLMTDAPRLAARALGIVCKFHRSSGNKTSNATEGQSSQESSLIKLCRHPEEANKLPVLLRLLPTICNNTEEPGTTMPDESSGEVTTEYVTPESDATPVAAVEVETSTPAVTDVEHSLSNWELWEVLCQHLQLMTDTTRLGAETLGIACKLHRRSGKKTISATEGQSSVQQPSLPSQESSLIRLCRHPEEAKRLPVLWRHLPTICNNTEEPGTTVPDESLGNVTTEYVTPESDATTAAAVDVETSTPVVTDMVHRLSNWEIWHVLCQHLHLMTDAQKLGKQAIGEICKIRARIDEYKQGRSSVQQPSLSSQESLIKLRELCRHPEEVDQHHFLAPYVPVICNNTAEPVIADHVTTEADTRPEAMPGVATETAYAYSSKPDMSSAQPYADGALSFSGTDLDIEACQVLDLIDVPEENKLLLSHFCSRLMTYEMKTSTASVRSRLERFREVCAHLDQLKPSPFRLFRPHICNSTTAEAGSSS